MYKAVAWPYAQYAVFIAFSVLACGDDDASTRQPEHPSVQFGNSEARACDLLFEVGDAEISSVRFSDVRGAYFQRASKLGISVTALNDGPLPNGSVALELHALADEPVLESARCYDRTGSKLDASDVRLTL